MGDAPIFTKTRTGCAECKRKKIKVTTSYPFSITDHRHSFLARFLSVSHRSKVCSKSLTHVCFFNLHYSATKRNLLAPGVDDVPTDASMNLNSPGREVGLSRNLGNRILCKAESLGTPQRCSMLFHSTG
jgi:hypothetical protein